MPDGNGAPTMAELARRLERIEDKMDMRIVTIDVYQAREAVFTAKEAAHTVEIRGLETRIGALERANSTLTKMVIGAFLGLLVQVIVVLFTLIGKAGVPH
jgi:hypothetical protein